MLKKWPILAAIVGVVIIAVVAVVLLNPPLTEWEQEAVRAVEMLKDELADPSSLQVHGIRWKVFEYTDELSGLTSVTEIVLIDFSATNTFGGVTRDKVEVYDDEIHFASDADSDDIMVKAFANGVTRSWDECEDNVLDVKKVMRKVGK